MTSDDLDRKNLQVTNIHTELSIMVYRHLGDFSLGQGPVGGSASWGECQLGEVPVGEVPVGGLGPVGGQNLTLGRTFFF